MSFFHWSKVQPFFFLANWRLVSPQLSSLISGSLKAEQLFQGFNFTNWWKDQDFLFLTTFLPWTRLTTICPGFNNALEGLQPSFSSFGKLVEQSETEEHYSTTAGHVFPAWEASHCIRWGWITCCQTKHMNHSMISLVKSRWSSCFFFGPAVFVLFLHLTFFVIFHLCIHWLKI